MSEIASLQFANEAFYLIFGNRDFAGMDALWAAHENVSCIHPGWEALDNREDVMASWKSLMANENSPSITCRAPRARIIGETGVVVCYELLGSSVLVATNIFVKDGTAWKMVHHQAGPCRGLPDDLSEEPEAPGVQ